MTKTFWLSFGRKHGVVIVEVTEEEVDEARAALADCFPPGADWWLVAALRKAHRLGCNPGGEVMSIEMPPDVPEHDWPKDRLLSVEEMTALYGGSPPPILKPEELEMLLDEKTDGRTH